ncbi:MAG TPA: dynamin family protein [Nocardioides sp.]|uniref:dynamin family protein n=1 Tax=Nocardioides sp. TaxID=35761 RepID=UPI002E337848|nr:dynamin family protein [Nocardioides sp.]HEX3929243.1 dynamin family protein [Nocardioides sp.]
MTSTGSYMLAALVRLRAALQGASLPLDVPSVADHRAAREEMADQLEDYVIPRIVTLEAPLLAVVGGSTGAGKSTLVNSLVGSVVTESGVLRPTTRSPVLVHNPADTEWFGADRLLPDLERVHHPTHDPHSLQLVPLDVVPQGLAILDAPDVDSVEESNRRLAAQLLAAADLWLFVTSAARYADQVPWDFLREAAERSAAVAVVLDRTPVDALETVSSHLARMLAARGLKDSPLFTIHEVELSDSGLVAPRHVAEIRAWLAELGGDPDARAEMVKQTIEGAVRSLTRRAHFVADGCVQQSESAQRLREAADAAYDDEIRAVLAATSDGTLLRGEVLVRWQELVGTGELLSTLEAKVGWIRDRMVNAIKGKPQQAERVNAAVAASLESLVLEHGEAAAESAAESWRGLAAGRDLLADVGEGLVRASNGLRRQAGRAVGQWQEEVLELVRAEGADKRTTARFLAYGVSGLGVAVMVVVLAGPEQSGDAEGGISAQSAQLGRTLLEAVLGGEAVGSLLDEARRRLESTVRALLDEERHRYLDLLASLRIDPDAADILRNAARGVDDLRYATVERSGTHSH